MKYLTIAPEVDAYKITRIGDQTTAGLDLFCDDGINRLATPRMLARALVPRPGDFFVTQQSPAYNYVVPQEMWERTHARVAGEKAHGAGQAPTPPQTHGAGGGANAA